MVERPAGAPTGQFPAHPAAFPPSGSRKSELAAARPGPCAERPPSIRLEAGLCQTHFFRPLKTWLARCLPAGQQCLVPSVLCQSLLTLSGCSQHPPCPGTAAEPALQGLGAHGCVRICRLEQGSRQNPGGRRLPFATPSCHCLFPVMKSAQHTLRSPSCPCSRAGNNSSWEESRSLPSREF